MAQTYRTKEPQTEIAKYRLNRRKWIMLQLFLLLYDGNLEGHIIQKKFKLKRFFLCKRSFIILNDLSLVCFLLLPLRLSQCVRNNCRVIKSLCLLPSYTASGTVALLSGLYGGHCIALHLTLFTKTCVLCSKVYYEIRGF